MTIVPRTMPKWESAAGMASVPAPTTALQRYVSTRIQNLSLGDSKRRHTRIQQIDDTADHTRLTAAGRVFRMNSMATVTTAPSVLSRHVGGRGSTVPGWRTAISGYGGIIRHSLTGCLLPACLPPPSLPGTSAQKYRLIVLSVDFDRRMSRIMRRWLDDAASPKCPGCGFAWICAFATAGRKSRFPCDNPLLDSRQEETRDVSCNW